MEGDLGAVGAVHGVPTAPDSEGVQGVGVQVTHDSAGTVHSVRSPPHATVLAILLGRGLAGASESGDKDNKPIAVCLRHPSRFKTCLHSNLSIILCCHGISDATHLRYSST